MNPEAALPAIRRLERDVEEQLAAARRDAEAQLAAVAGEAARAIELARGRGGAEAARRHRAALEAADRQVASIEAGAAAEAAAIRRRGETRRDEAAERMIAFVLGEA